MKKRMNSQHYTLFFLLSFLLMALSLHVSCQTESSTTKQAIIDPVAQPEAYGALARALSWGGNLHYENFIAYANGKFYLSVDDKNMGRLDPAQNRIQKMNSPAGLWLSSFEDWLFYSVMPPGAFIQKVKTDDTNAVRVSSISCQYLISDHDHLFAIETATGEVFRIQHDGRLYQTLFDGIATEMIYDGLFLYVCGADKKTGLIRIDPESNTSECLLNRRVSSLNKVEDHFYFIDPSDQNRIHLWHEKTKEDRRISSFSLTRPFIVSEGWLYYLSAEKQNCLMRVPLTADGLNEKRMETIVADQVASFVVFPDVIFYRRADGKRTYRVSLPGGVPIRLT
ncbi:MAG: DUF5050 domain-containing protein [Clostridia bacterium]|nr:DUF5050 domain-containing protein [Clostridia bacterium]